MLRLQPDRCSRTLRVLADPLRLRLIRLLHDGPKTVGDLAKLNDDAKKLDIPNVIVPTTTSEKATGK